VLPSDMPREALQRAMQVRSRCTAVGYVFTHRSIESRAACVTLQMARESSAIRAVIARAAWRSMQRVLLAAPANMPTNCVTWSMCFQHVRIVPVDGYVPFLL
jgi:hypothetical protein